jgi:hypothetical protein
MTAFQAVVKFGFSERQARFLVTVMLHAGVCVPRQYAVFAGTAYGHKVTRFFDKLVERRYATASDCLHNRAALYHIQHQALYRAIGQPQSRYRRPVSARQAIDRVRLLDGVISHPELTWLATEDDKVAFFNLMAPLLPPELLPHTVKASSGRVRLFPDALPIGVERNGRVVLLYLVTGPFDSNVRSFLQRHAELLRALPGWTLQLLFIRRAEGMMSTFATLCARSSRDGSRRTRCPNSSGTAKSAGTPLTCAPAPSLTRVSGGPIEPSPRRAFRCSTDAG